MHMDGWCQCHQRHQHCGSRGAFKNRREGFSHICLPVRNRNVSGRMQNDWKEKGAVPQRERMGKVQTRGPQREQMSNRIPANSESHPGIPDTLINHTSSGQGPSSCPTARDGMRLWIPSQPARSLQRIEEWLWRLVHVSLSFIQSLSRCPWRAHQGRSKDLPEYELQMQNRIQCVDMF